MTAVSTPFGLKPVGLKGGQVWSQADILYPIASNYGTAIYYGDPVVMSGGNVTKAAYNYSTNGTIGVFLGCKYTDPIIKQPRWSQYYPASTVASDIQAFVAFDPDTVFIGQVDGPVTAARLNLNVGFSNTLTTGNTITGVSTGALDHTLLGTSTQQFRIVGLHETPDNAWGDAFTIVRLVHNFGYHQWMSATGA